jgi:hypothetical protein
MKIYNFYKATGLVTLITALSLSLISCDKNNDDTMNNSDVFALSGNASASQEVPSNSSPGTGTLSGSYNRATNVLQYNITWSGLTGSVTGMHFHGPAAAGVSAGILVSLNVTNSAATGSGSGTVTVSDEVESALMSGNVYYNIHTALYPAGEIRGQVVVAKSGGGTGDGGGGGGGY